MQKLSKAQFERISSFKGVGDALESLGLDVKLTTFRKAGVGIGAFARLCEVPVSTVRHYINLGLVDPYRVEGKWRFHPINVLQVSSVRSWQELGVSLEALQARRLRKPDVLFEEVLPQIRWDSTTTRDWAIVRLRRERRDDGSYEVVETGLSEGDASDPVWGELVRELQETRERLEARRASLDQKLARLQSMQAAMR
jgi:DNA-binding transcriptional MerR regulator